MYSNRLIVLGVLILLLSISAGAQVDARMFRQPDVSEKYITFVYAGDIWIVAKEGGTAHRLSSPTGEESFPRFSPDGSHIAFSANYDGNIDVYVLPVLGGIPERLTYHPGVDRLVDWYPGGNKLMFASSRESGSFRFNQFYSVSAKGGLPDKLPVAYGEYGAISPDERTLAFMPEFYGFGSWKRYRGGYASEIWLFDLENLSAKNMTESDAVDGFPVWHQRKVYFLSDRGSNQRKNIWSYDLDTEEYRRLLHILDVVKNDSWQLFNDMNEYNRFSKEMRARMISSLEKVDKELRSE